MDPKSAQPRDLIRGQQVQAGEGALAAHPSGQRRAEAYRGPPRLVNWLIQRAKICGVDPRWYQLPGTATELHGIPRYNQKDGFRRFLAELSRDRGMSLLRQWIRQG